MKKIYLLIIFAFCSFTFSFAQDAAAKNILDNVSAKVKSFSGMTANFSYITTDHNGKKRGDVSGQIFIKGQKYYIKQGTTELYSNGSKTWNYNAENQEVTVGDISDGDSKALTPQKLLSNFYDKDFTYTLTSSAGNFDQIDLVPIDKRKNFKTVTVFVDKNKSLITKAKVIDKSDNVVTFTLSNEKTNVVIPDNKFEFDAKTHPGVDVISQ